MKYPNYIKNFLVLEVANGFLFLYFLASHCCFKAQTKILRFITHSGKNKDEKNILRV